MQHTTVLERNVKKNINLQKLQTKPRTQLQQYQMHRIRTISVDAINVTRQATVVIFASTASATLAAIVLIFVCLPVSYLVVHIDV
jgi:hypothetical protein